MFFRIKFKVSVIAFKIRNKIAPGYLQSKVKMFQPISDRPVRPGCGRDEFMFESNVEMHKNSTIISSLVLEWNKLPYQLRCLEDLEVFKNKLKTHYFNEAFPNFS